MASDVLNITDEQKEIFETGNDLVASGECHTLSLIDCYDMDGTTFYMIQYDCENSKKMYALFFEGHGKAMALESKMGATIAGFCEYQKITGKKLKGR